MGLLQNTLDAGAAGTAITNGNSGGLNGDAFTTTGAGRTYTADAFHGALAADFLLASGDSADYMAWAWTAAADGTTQIYFKLKAAVTATSPWFALRASGASILQLAFNTSNQFTVLDAASANKYTSAALTLDVWYRIDLAWNVATSTTGTLKLDYYLGDGTTPVTTGLSITNANLGAVNADGVRYGFNSSAASARHMVIDSPRARYAEGTTYLAPFGINQAPTVSVTPKQIVAAGASFAVTATAADVDGTIAGYLWHIDFPASGGPAGIEGATTATANGTAGAAGSRATIRCTVTDDDSATAYAVTEIAVPKSGTTTTLPGNGQSVGTWTNVGGAASIGAALADASDATYVEGPTASGTEQSLRLPLEASTTRATGSFTERLAQDAAGALSLKVRVYEGTTLRQEWTQALTTAAADYTFTFSTGTVAAITDWTNLFVEYAYTT